MNKTDEKEQDKAVMMDNKQANDEKEKEIQQMKEKNSLLCDYVRRLEREIDEKKETEKEKQSENANLADLLKQTLSRVNQLEDNLKTMKPHESQGSQGSQGSQHSQGSQGSQGNDKQTGSELPKKGHTSSDKDMKKVTSDEEQCSDSGGV